MAREEYSREGEREAHRLDRNYGELLQELRVAQTGVQILFAFLLTIGFQQRFAEVEGYQKVFYLITLAAAAIAAVMLIGPVAVHRLLFRRHLKDEIVDTTARLAAVGLFFLGLSMATALLFVVDVVANLATAVVLSAAVAAAMVVVWLMLPLRQRRGHPELTDENSDTSA